MRKPVQETAATGIYVNIEELKYICIEYLSYEVYIYPCVGCSMCDALHMTCNIVIFYVCLRSIIPDVDVGL